MSGAGDVNNDGFDDLIVGALQDDNNGQNSGMARIFSGQSGGVLFSIDGDAAGIAFGSSVAGVGDLDGDEFDDFLVGATIDDTLAPDAGSATVFSGQNASVIYDIDAAITEDHFGWSVSDAGDVNGDGVPDFIVGAPEDAVFGPKREGYAKVFSGANGAALHTFDGLANGDFFGWSVSGAGDVNEDGYDDVIVGARQFVFSGGGGNGYARVFSGLDGALLYHLAGDGPDDRFGTSVSGLGDLDGDGADDFIVGAPETDFEPGYARVYSGRTGAAIANFVGSGNADAFGYSVSDAGDVNGDGVGDIVVGAPGPLSLPLAGPEKSDPPILGTYAQVYSGATGAEIFTVTGFQDLLGGSVSSAGDVNGDGVSEVIVGAPDSLHSQPGYARVYALACTDGDGDGYGNPGLATCPAGPETDCDDADPDVNPGAAEIPGNGKDDDCNPATPGGCAPAETVAGGAAWGAIGYLAAAGLLAGLARRRGKSPSP